MRRAFPFSRQWSDRGKQAWRALPWVLAALGPVARAADGVVELPPMVVSDSTVRWRHATAPGLEVISRCSDDTTTALMRRAQRLNELLRVALPAEFQQQLSLPEMLVLTSSNASAALSQSLVKEFDADQRKAPPGAAAAPPGRGGRAVRYMANLQLDDWDERVIFAVIDESTFAADAVTLNRAQIRATLQRRVPALPAWVVEGFVALFAEMNFQAAQIVVDPLPWISAEVTQRLRTDPDFPRRMLALPDLFARRTPETKGDPEFTRVWQCEAALFICWALEGEGAPRRAAFWKFVDRLGTEPPTEALMEECFGMGASDLRDRLSDYLRLAVQTTGRLKPERLEPVAEIKLRDATEGEVARIKGDWERLEVNYVRAHSPEYAPQYLSLARSTLVRAAELGADDPRILAVRGLCELEAGDTAKAREYLEGAVRGGAAGPRAYAETARLRFLEARANPGAPPDQLSVAQANAILEPLTAARGQLPQLPQSYIIPAQVWLMSTGELKPANLALLDEGLRLFAEDPVLLYSMALLRASRGANAEALALAKRGLALDLSDANRAAFERLQAALADR